MVTGKQEEREPASLAPDKAVYQFYVRYLHNIMYISCKCLAKQVTHIHCMWGGKGRGERGIWLMKGVLTLKSGLTQSW